MTNSKKLLSVLIIISLSVLGLVVYAANIDFDKVAIGKETNNTPNAEDLKSGVPKGIMAGDIMPGLFDLGNGKFQYQVKNQTEKDKTFKFTSSQRFDYAVKTEDGNQVYLFSSVALFMAALGEETLKPGEELTYTFDLSELNLEKGKYILEVWLTPVGDENYRVVMDYMVK